MSQLKATLSDWIEPISQMPLIADVTATCIGFMSLMVIYLFAKRLFLPSIQRFVIYLSPNKAGSLRPLLDKFNGRLAVMLCCVIYLSTLTLVFPFSEYLIFSGYYLSHVYF